MARKRIRKKHSVKAHLQVMELAKAGSSRDLAINASKDRLGTPIIGRGSLARADNLSTLDMQRQLTSMQTPKARKRMKAPFDASSAQLGRAAVKAARNQWDLLS